jgi:hypothetical protein
VDAPAAPVLNSSNPLRWILLGCGALTLLSILGAAGLAGVFYLVYKGTNGVALIGAEYLRVSELQRVGGIRVERKLLGWNVSVVNDGGHAEIPYSFKDRNGTTLGDARVWLVRSGGKWSAMGARVRHFGAEEFTIGNPPNAHFHLRSDWN